MSLSIKIRWGVVNGGLWITEVKEWKFATKRARTEMVDVLVSKGFVPRGILRPMGEQDVDVKASGAKTALELIDLNEAAGKSKRDTVTNVVKRFDGPSAQSPAVLPKHPKPSVINVARRGSPVIFLPPENQPPSSSETIGHSQPGRPLRRRTTVDRDPTAIAMLPPTPRPTSIVEAIERKHPDTAVYAPVEKKLVARRPAPAPPMDVRPIAPVQEVANLQPVRPAPRPPLQVSSSIALESSSGETREPEERTSNPEESEVEFYVAMYAFTASSENELSLAEGQILAVHDKKDLESNPDWWLVEDEDGALGYVPGNYLTPYTGERR